MVRLVAESLFFDDETNTWPYHAPALHINGGGARIGPRLSTARRSACSAVSPQPIPTPAERLAAALKEYGALRRTSYARYLSDPTYRHRISRQLNKGDSLHAVKRDLLYAHEGTVRARRLQQQTEQAWCLTLVTNAVVAWTTEYYGLAVESMRAPNPRRRSRPGCPASARPAAAPASWAFFASCRV